MHIAGPLRLLVLTFAIEMSCRSQQLNRPEGELVTLKGTIKLIHDYGPPGFGEDRRHDAHISYWALVVPVRVNLPCAGDFAGDCQPAKRINLFFDGDALKRIGERQAAKWHGRKVVVRGKLHRADTAGEMTPIYMDATEITALTTKKLPK